MAAEKIQKAVSNSVVELHNIKDVALSKAVEYDLLILGISTWDYGELQEDWESQWQDIANLDLTGKIIALYGMGDQIGYSEWFQDALGMLHEQVLAQGAYMIGYWPNIGYEFSASKGLTADKSQFVGLSLDDDNQYQLSDERIAKWCNQVECEITDILAD